MLRNYGSRGDDGACPDTRVVENDRTDADQHLVLEGAAVYRGVVANGDPLSDVNGVEIAHAVENGAVLTVRACAAANGVHVSAHDGIHPDARLLSEYNVSDDLSAGIDVTAGWYGGPHSLVATNHGVSTMNDLYQSSLNACSTFDWIAYSYGSLLARL